MPNGSGQHDELRARCFIATTTPVRARLARVIDEGNVWSDKVGMARKGKGKNRLDEAVEKAEAKAATGEHWKIAPALMPALKQAAAAATATESCAHHRPSAAPPFHCEKCGKPLSGQELVLMAVARLDDDALATLAEKTGELLTPEERQRIDAELGVDKSEAGDWRNRGAFAITTKGDRLGLTADEAKIADGLAAIREWETENGALTPEELAAAPTAVCNEHVPNEEKPHECAKCGKPLPLRFDAAIDEARQSEKRFTDDEWRDIDPIRAGETEAGPVKMTERAADDGPSYEGNPRLVKLDELWAMRLSVLANEAGESRGDYLTKLIRRQWVARGKGA